MVVLLVFHLIGLALGVGSATAKVVLLVKCYRDITFVPFYLKVMVPLTRTLVLGLILMTVSGIIWLIRGYGFPATNDCKTGICRSSMDSRAC